MRNALGDKRPIPVTMFLYTVCTVCPTLHALCYSCSIVLYLLCSTGTTCTVWIYCPNSICSTFCLVIIAPHWCHNFIIYYTKTLKNAILFCCLLVYGQNDNKTLYYCTTSWKVIYMIYIYSCTWTALALSRSPLMQMHIVFFPFFNHVNINLNCRRIIWAILRSRVFPS